MNDFQVGVSISPAALSFGNVVVGQNATATLAVTNSGSASVPFSAVLAGPDAAEFAIVGGTCGPIATLGPGASCTLDIRFAPTSQVAKSASVTIGGSPALASAALSGTGIPLIVTGTNFTDTVVGQAATITFVITNSGTAAVPFTVVFAGPNANQFSFSGGTCKSVLTLGPGANCTFQLRFAPTSPGAKSASVTIGGSPPLVSSSLTGTGIAATVTVSPAALSFGNITVGQSTTQSLNVTNIGMAGVPLSSSFTGTNAGQFVRTGGTCGSITMLGAGMSCSVQIQFAPVSTGAKSASFIIGSPALASAALSGTGT